ncbi:MAG: ATP-binding protein [Candidatus Izemoplasmatales bacterium]|jgi:MinD superfamily P-loop ATPase
MKSLNIAVLSGKGGAGKTMVAVNFAALANQAVYADCDIEEPDGYLFFLPEIVESTPVIVKVPEINVDQCTGCRKCVDFCRFHALGLIRGKAVSFPEICHSCGGCVLVCQNGSITEKPRIIGVVEEGNRDNIRILSGFLTPGEESGVPIIRAIIRKFRPKESLRILDCPPGCSCPVTESVSHADYCILVTEPTTFGRDNLQMVHELIRLLGKPIGVILNKSVDGYDPSEEYCLRENLRILGKIPYDEELALISSQGKIAVRGSSRWRTLFSAIFQSVLEEAYRETALDSQR